MTAANTGAQTPATTGAASAPDEPRAPWHRPFFNKLRDSLENVATAMLAGSVALFQWFLAKFFESVSSTDSLGLPFDRLLLLFLGAYVTLPLLLIAHVAASNEKMSWPRITSLVGLCALLSVAIERLTHADSTAFGLLALGLGTVLIAWRLYAALDTSRKAQLEQLKKSSAPPPPFFKRDLTRSQLVIGYGIIAIGALVGLTWSMSPQAVAQYFRPCLFADSSFSANGDTGQNVERGTRATASALCVYTQMRDTLALQNIEPEARRMEALRRRADALFTRGTTLHWNSDMDDVSHGGMIAVNRLLSRHVALSVTCDSLKLAARVRAATDTSTVSTTGSNQKQNPAILNERAAAEAAARACVPGLAFADSAARESAMQSHRRAVFFATWLRVQWAARINQGRQVMVAAYLAALLLLSYWIYTTQTYTQSRIQRQVGTLFATLIFFIPLLPGVRAVDLPLLDPTRLFQFPQWKLTTTVAAAEPGRPGTRVEVIRTAADSSLLREIRKQDSTLAGLRDEISRLGGLMPDTETRAVLVGHKERLDSIRKTLREVDSLSNSRLSRIK